MSQGLMAEHRRQLEAAFRHIKVALSAAERNRARQQLQLLLTAHASAEAAMRNSAAGLTGAKDATPPTVKAEIDALDKLQPLTREYFQKLDLIRSAVANHLAEIETSWWADRPQSLTAADPSLLASQYRAEVERYVGHYGSA